MLNSSLPVRRSVFIALAAVALTLVLLRPVCDVWFAHFGAGASGAHAATLTDNATFEHGGDPAVQCCTSVGNAHHIVPLQVVAAGVGAPPGLAPAALLAVLLFGITIVDRQPRRLRAPPRSPQSFYLRSARILR